MGNFVFVKTFFWHYKMRNIILIVFSLLCFGIMTQAQISGVYTIPGGVYPTVASAIAAVNNSGVGAGGVIFNITAGYVETFNSAMAGYIATNTGSVSSPIIFQKSGSGTNPKIISAAGTGSMDAIICLVGVNYVTFNGIDLQDNPANLNNTTRMEWGYAMVKASGIQGSSNNTINNCTITMNSADTSTYGIYLDNTTPYSQAQLIVTTVSGQNSNNKLYGNTILNSYKGIFLRGFNDPASPYQYYDQNNDIGSVSGNTIPTLGGANALAYGIRGYCQNNLKVANTTIQGGTGTTLDVAGIYLTDATNANLEIYGNTITVASSGTNSYLYGIYNYIGDNGTSNTVSIHENVVHDCTYPTAISGPMIAIINYSYAANVVCNNNSVENNTFHGSGGTNFTGIEIWAGITSGQVYNNSVFNNTGTGVGSGLEAISLDSWAISNIMHDNIAYNNSIINGSGSNSTFIYGISCSLRSLVTSTTTIDFYNNIFHDNFIGGNANVNEIWAMEVSNAFWAPHKMYLANIHDNSVYNIVYSGSLSKTCSFSGILCARIKTCNIYNNSIYGITMPGFYPITGLKTWIDGLHLEDITTANIYNNYIYNLKTPNSFNLRSVLGVSIGPEIPAFGNSSFNLYYNTIYLNSVSTSTTTFGTVGLYANTSLSNLDLRNNIIVNTSSCSGNGYSTVAYQRSDNNLSTYSMTSNNNDFYAGTPSPNNLIFSDGTNNIQTLSAYKTFMYPRDSASISEMPPFMNITTLPYDLHLDPNVLTHCESGGKVISTPVSITTDFDGNPRYPNPGYPNNPSSPATAPDIGADEFGGLKINPVPAPPVAVTNPASGISTTGATLNGLITANYLNTTITFDWGLTSAYGNTITAMPGSATGGIPINVSAALSGLIPSTTYHFRVHAVNSMGTAVGGDLTFFTACNISQAGTITGPIQACQGGTGYVYTVPPITNATSYNWTLPVGSTLTSGAGTNTITVSYGNNAVSGYLMVYGSAACGSGAPSQLMVTVNPAPVPTVSGPASCCAQSQNNVYTTEPGKSNYSWTVSAGGTITGGTGTNSVSVTWNTAGSQSLSVTYSNTTGCMAINPTSFPVIVNPTPIPLITGPTSSCQGNTITYSTQSGQTNYQWTVSTGGQLLSGQGTNSISVKWNSSGNQSVGVNYTNPFGCTAISPAILAITINPAPVPTISGNNSLCATSGYYTYTTESGMSGYNWVVSPGGNLASGQGTNAIQVYWATPGAQTVSVTYSNTNGCQAMDPTIYPVTVNGVPPAAGPITGASTVCVGTQNVTYSVLPVQGALAYVWTLPIGASTTTGSATNSIMVNYSLNAQSGTITSAANNLCGSGLTSVLNITVDPIPPRPSITASGNLLTSDATQGNQWYHEGISIPGANAQTYQVPISQPGWYWTVVTLIGCESDSSNHRYIQGVGMADKTEPTISIYPVPNPGRFTLSINGETATDCSIEVYSSFGIMIHREEHLEINSQINHQVVLGLVPEGLYTVLIEFNGKRITRKIIVGKAGD